MKLVATLAALTAPLCLAGCSGAYWGNLIVLGVSAGIFCGTLSLGRDSVASRSRADASQSSADHT